MEEYSSTVSCEYLIPGDSMKDEFSGEWGDFLPVFKEEKEDNHAEHLLKFHECMDLLDLQHEYVHAFIVW